MRRQVYAQRRVLELYQCIDTLTYPFDMDAAIRTIPNCQMHSYGRMAKMTGCGFDDIRKMCASDDGATIFDASSHRFLVLFNEQDRNDGRIRWTQAHEIGHICLGHFKMGGILQDQEPNSEIRIMLEQEAEFFAWNLLAPLPVVRAIGITDPLQMRSQFGLSGQAADLHFKRYEGWAKSHIKTSWENDILREFYWKYKPDQYLSV